LIKKWCGFIINPHCKYGKPTQLGLRETFQADSFAMNSKAKISGIVPDKSSAYPDEMN